ncbi:Nicotinamide riboside kinase 1 [Trabala vishnou gigantina nucleopolyhedrovirus]|uniref:Nicotinamide riboside kinase 1 n=1 Tax=Trabala vishnou gigantina nucleopolyhedrovirus TaxID=2863583 RepID=UPI0024820320|nr:Nicotinamide riboside kinase 1 [Trabala vishnou gigantina nucleopolyhedrovirus]QYC92679.1 Nicotinamide riboside kinase 1 [Trabala vishnou gigantina nucleopolyhedrovirus]
MSHLLALGGVACTTKTTILNKLAKHHNIVVHLNDYKELHDKYNFDHRVGGILFSALRIKNDCMHANDYDNVHVFDRHPMESLVYATMHNGIDDESTLETFNVCKRMGLFDNWNFVLLTPASNSEMEIVKMMKRRDNKIDKYTIDYVTEQYRKFQLWRTVTKAETIAVDLRADIGLQQDRIVARIVNKIFRDWMCFPDKMYRLAFKLPLLHNKIAAFNFEGTLICSEYVVAYTTTTTNADNEDIVAAIANIDVNDKAIANTNNFAADNFSSASTGAATAVDCVSWRIKYTDIRSKFVRLLKEKYTIVIMANEAGSVAHTREKIEKFCKAINVPMFAVFSTPDNRKYKKPNVGLMEHFALQQKLNLAASFYCGNDSDGVLNCDYKFAKNCNVNFIYDFEMFDHESAYETFV